MASTQVSAESEQIKVQIEVADQDWVGYFDRIEVSRSRGSAAGPYEPMTGSFLAPARLPRGVDTPPVSPITGPELPLIGKTLVFTINEGAKTSMTFEDPGGGTITTQQALGQVVAASLGRLTGWVTVTGKLVLQTLEVGTSASLAVMAGEAALTLGLPTQEPDNVSYGQVPHIVLVAGRTTYTFEDRRGSSSYWYRTRFRSSSDSVVSPFGVPTQPSSPDALPSSNLIVGTIKLIALDGSGLAGLRVRVMSRNNRRLTDGRMVAGPTLDRTTDTRGVATFSLVRGQDVQVAVEGTDLVRDVTVPSDPALLTFDLLDPAIGSSDAFDVQVPRLNYATRRSI